MRGLNFTWKNLRLTCETLRCFPQHKQNFFKDRNSNLQEAAVEWKMARTQTQTQTQTVPQTMRLAAPTFES